MKDILKVYLNSDTRPLDVEVYLIQMSVTLSNEVSHLKGTHKPRAHVYLNARVVICSSHKICPQILCFHTLNFFISDCDSQLTYIILLAAIDISDPKIAVFVCDCVLNPVTEESDNSCRELSKTTTWFGKQSAQVLGQWLGLLPILLLYGCSSAIFPFLFGRSQ